MESSGASPIRLEWRVDLWKIQPPSGRTRNGFDEDIQMSPIPERPPRKITPEEIATYRRDGVLMARDLLPPAWLARIERAVVKVMEAPTPMAAVFSKPEDGFHMEAGMFVSDDDIRDVVRESPLASIAQEMMGSDSIHFFYDQMFCKQPGSQFPTPWHHDITFWPVAGDEICSIWVPLDSVTRESSGLEFVRGSHRWDQRFKAITPMYNEQLVNPEHEDVPDIDGHRGDYDLVGWSMEPGDILLFHPGTLHGSSANYDLERKRRAISFRWLGDDVTYEPTPYTMPFNGMGLSPGDRIAEPAFAHIIGA
jgi:hypothetical protein